MTARWRKKLEGIDEVGPGDEVYERAKGGPTLPEPQSPMQRTSTRVVTAIAALVVFALAISLFAIPTLRLHEGSSALSAGGQLLPLWPARTTDEVQTLQAEADAGDAPWALAPGLVAERFGVEVLGWPSASIGSTNLPDPACGPIAIPIGSPPPSTVSSCGGNATADLTNQVSVCPPPEGTVAACASSSGTVSGPFVRATILSCGGAVQCSAPDVEYLDLFQPGGTGDGKVWAVFSAMNASIDLAVSPGQIVTNGSSISTGLGIPVGDAFGFGVHVGASATCNQAVATDLYHGPGSPGEPFIAAGSELGVNLGSRDGSGCEEEEPGYVFVATSHGTVVTDGTAADPLQGGGLTLTSFAAVPITFQWPDTAVSSPPPPTVEAVALTTYKDELGWTIDVPTSWVRRAIAGSDATRSYEGAAFGSATPIQAPGGPETIGAAPGEVTLELYNTKGPKVSPQDDSSLPLSFDRLDPVDGGYLLDFRADGLPFTLAVRVGGGAPTGEQLSILTQMVSSIRFDPWQFGDTRNGWTALHPTTDDDQKQQNAGISWQRCDATGCFVLVYGPYTGAPYMLGPIQPCGEGESMTADPSSIFKIVLQCPDGTTQAWGTPGEPSPSNSAGYGVPLNVQPVIRAWDGTLLGAFGMTTSQVPAFPTPTPSP